MPSLSSEHMLTHTYTSVHMLTPASAHKPLCAHTDLGQGKEEAAPRLEAWFFHLLHHNLECIPEPLCSWDKLLPHTMGDESQCRGPDSRVNASLC